MPYIPPSPQTPAPAPQIAVPFNQTEFAAAFASGVKPRSVPPPTGGVPYASMVPSAQARQNVLASASVSGGGGGFVTSQQLGWQYGPQVKVSPVAAKILEQSRTSALARQGDMLVTTPDAPQTAAALFRSRGHI